MFNRLPYFRCLKLNSSLSFFSVTLLPLSLRNFNNYDVSETRFLIADFEYTINTTATVAADV